MFTRGQNDKLRTHVPGLDEITGGGLPRSSAVLFDGAQDGCKEMLVRQICWNVLQDGGKIMYCTVDQPTETIRNYMTDRGWDINPFEKAGKFRFVDIFSEISEKETDSGPEPHKAVTRFADGYRARTAMNLSSYSGFRFFPLIDLSRVPRIVVMDSLSPLFSPREEDNRQLLNGLREATRMSRATGCATIHSDVSGQTYGEAIRSIADAVIHIDTRDPLTLAGSFIEITKYVGEHSQGRYPIEDDGRRLRVVIGNS